jgi:hypothetical protein
MQRKPVPALLAGFQKLAAPLPVKPTLPTDVQRLIAQGDPAVDLKVHQTEIHGTLAIGGFGAETLIAVSYRLSGDAQGQIVGPAIRRDLQPP